MVLTASTLCGCTCPRTPPVQCFLWLAVGSAIFALRLPERLGPPGMFDVFGHSHSVFHVLVVVAVRYRGHPPPIHTPHLICIESIHRLYVSGCICVLSLRYYHQAVVQAFLHRGEF